MLRYLLRGYLLRRLLRGSARHGRGVFMTPRRGTYYAGRPRARTNVRVGGCCLPVPLGMLAGLIAGGGLARRGRR